MARVRPFKALQSAGVAASAASSQELVQPVRWLEAPDVPSLLRRWHSEGVLQESAAAFYLVELESAGARTPVRLLIGSVEEGGAWLPLEEEAPAVRSPWVELTP